MAAAVASKTHGRLNRSGKPFLIWAAPPVLVLYACTSVAFPLLLLADGGAGTVFAEIDGGVAIPTGVALALMAVFFAVYLAAAYGLFQERLWARPLLAAAPAAFGVIGMALHFALARDSIRSLLAVDWTWAAAAGAVYLYLYHYGPAVRYYDRLRRSTGS